MTRFGMALGAACLAIGAVPVTAAAQVEAAQVVEGAGVKIGEGTVIHPVLGIETGIVHNVFYEDTNVVTSGVLRVIGELAVGSLPPERMQTLPESEADTTNYGDFAFRADVHGEYEEYLTSNDNTRAQRNFAFSGLMRGLIYPKRTWQFAFSEQLRRETRPVNFESRDDTNRIINQVGLELRYKPVGRTLSGSLRFANTIDYFENSSQQFANRMQNTGGVRVNWQRLPVTRLYGDLSLGFAGGLGSASTRPSSMPLRILVGIQSAITVKSSINARIGFGKGFYASGPDFTNVIGALQVGYRFSPHGRMGAMYEYDFQDSINANYYRDHALKIMIGQQFDRFTLSAAAELRFRLYEGVIMEVMGTTPNRSDLIVQIPIGATYNFRDWIAATADYVFTTDQTDFRYIPQAGGPADDPSYTRHVFLAGVRAAY